jgi:hypothetical protein
MNRARPVRRDHYVMHERRTLRCFRVTREEVQAMRRAGGDPNVLAMEIAAAIALAWLWREVAEHWARV